MIQNSKSFSFVQLIQTFEKLPSLPSTRSKLAQSYHVSLPEHNQLPSTPSILHRSIIENMDCWNNLSLAEKRGITNDINGEERVKN